MTITIFDYPGTRFDDQEAAVEELLFLVEQTGQTHGVFYAEGRDRDVWNVGPWPDQWSRRPLVICQPEFMGASCEN